LRAVGDEDRVVIQVARRPVWH